MNPRNPIPSWITHSLLIGAAIFCTTPLKARAAPAADAVQALTVYLERATAGLPGRVDIVVGSIDERIRLAPCTRVEPYVPQGTRLWGRTVIGLKCLDAPGWNVFLPVEIKVFGRALTAARTLYPGDSAGPHDVREEEVELSRQPGIVVTQWPQLDGKTAVRMVSAGQVLRQEFFRAPPAVGAGDSVKLVYQGAGFSIMSDGRALSNAADGQPVRVQTGSGRVVQGVARAGRVVELQ